MELGEGLFFGLALLALVILYTNTKDRWNWAFAVPWFRAVLDFFVRRKRVIIWLVAVMAVLLASASGLSLWRDSRPYAPDYPEPTYMTSYWGLEIGSNKSDALFEKGNPDAKFVADENSHELWTYVDWKTRTYALSFKGDRLVMISLEELCTPENKSVYELISEFIHVQGVSLCDETSVLLERVGEPERITNINGGLRREYSYRKSLNVSYVLEQGRVISMSVGSAQ